MFIVEFLLSTVWAIVMLLTFIMNWQWIVTTACGLMVFYLAVAALVRLSGRSS
ncbi:MAG: hypothetical protein N2Z74_07265 [Syntrophales bacterium]|nr:hypothetical protein [Syntrophales bacterium]